MDKATISRALSTLMLLALLGACSSERASAAQHSAADGYTKLELRYQGWHGEVSLPELAEDLGFLAPLELHWVGNTISGPQDIQATLTGDIDFGAAFNGAIINLLAANAPIVAVIGASFVGAETFSGFYVPEGSPLKTPRDLVGKKVGVNTVGAHNEFMLKEWLRRGGLQRDEIQSVTLVVIPPVNMEQTLRAGQLDAAALGGIIREKALERGGLRLLFSDFELYGPRSSSSYVVSKRLIREHEASARKLVEAVARAIEWTRTQPRAEVIARMQRIIRERKRGEDVSLVSYWRPTVNPLQGGLLSEGDFQLWIDWLVRDGQLEREKLSAVRAYSNGLNPFAAQAP